MTKAEVEKEFWWKHDLEKAFPPTRLDVFCKSKKIEEITSPNVLIWDWSFGQDFAAYAYELARRPGGKLKLRPYPELNHDESLFLFRTFGQNKDHAPKGAWRSDLKNPAEARNGYSEARRWRLDIPIGTLKAIFEKFILSQRQAQGIKQRIKSGSVAKPPAWKKIELLDGQPDYLDRARAMSRAKKEAIKYLQIFKTKLKAEKRRNPRLCLILWPELDK